MLHVREVEHSPVSDSTLCGDGHPAEFKNSNCVVKKKTCVAGVGQRAGRLYFVKLQSTSENVLEAPVDNQNMLMLWC